jgi:hypothetical protein
VRAKYAGQRDYESSAQDDAAILVLSVFDEERLQLAAWFFVISVTVDRSRLATRPFWAIADSLADDGRGRHKKV